MFLLLFMCSQIEYRACALCMLFSLSEFQDLEGSWKGFGSGKSYASLFVPFQLGKFG